MAKKKSAERRKHLRVSLDLLIQMKAHDVGDFLKRFAPNISTGGIFIETDDDRNEGALLYVQISLDDGSTVIEALGRVVRRQPRTDKQPAGLGVEFVNLDERSARNVAFVVGQRRASET